MRAVLLYCRPSESSSLRNLEKYLSLAYLADCSSTPQCLATKQVSASLTAAVAAIYSYYCILLVLIVTISSCILSMSQLPFLDRWSLPSPPLLCLGLPASCPMRHPFLPGCRPPLSLSPRYLSITARNQLVCGLLLLLLHSVSFLAYLLHTYTFIILYRDLLLHRLTSC